MAQQDGAVVTKTHKYLTFELGAETYGLDILRVQEIIGLLPITRVPRTPLFVRGVINLRGRVIPVIDLRAKFELDRVDDTDRTCIIVVQIEDRATVMGVVVDEVSEVLDIPIDHIEETPEFGAAVDTGFVLGIGKVAERVVMVLDIAQVLSGDELAAVENLTDEA